MINALTHAKPCSASAAGANGFQVQGAAEMGTKLSNSDIRRRTMWCEIILLRHPQPRPGERASIKEARCIEEVTDLVKTEVGTTGSGSSVAR